MGKFNKGPQTNHTKSFIITDNRATGRTGEGAPGFARDAKSELFLLAVSNMVSEKAFYESAQDRDERFVNLVHEVAVTNPAWMAGFIPWLRNEANMRTASLVMGLEAARAMLKAKVPGGRSLVSSALVRADEPGEALAYWVSTYGRKIPKPVKRGIADAATRLYTERNYLKWDSGSATFRFADVIDLTHPEPKAPWQSNLFRYAIERRRNRMGSEQTHLPMIIANQDLRMIWVNGGANRLLETLNPQVLADAGMTWEDVLSALGSKIDKKVLWENLIPTMGYMALLRNLRNFDQAGIGTKAQDEVIAKLSSLEEVKKSRQFPFRFLSAYRNTGSLTWGRALEQAANFSLANIAELPGKTLILVDRSGSMFGRTSEKTQLTWADSAALFGTALALRNLGRTSLYEYGSSIGQVQIRAGDSLLRVSTERFHNLGGTYTAEAIRTTYQGHDRVIILTDEQSHSGNVFAPIPAHVPTYVWNLAGYRMGMAPSGTDNRHVFGGLVDSSFRLIPLLERGMDQGFPWETRKDLP